MGKSNEKTVRRNKITEKMSSEGETWYLSLLGLSESFRLVVAVVVVVIVVCVVVFLLIRSSS